MEKDISLDKVDRDITMVPGKRFKTQWNGVQNEENRYEPVSSKPSATIPDQSMSVGEIMRRYASGLPLGGERVPVYHGDEEFLPDERTLDLSEIEDLKNQNAQDIENKRKELNDLEAKRKEIAAEKAAKKIQSTKANVDKKIEAEKAE